MNKFNNSYLILIISFLSLLSCGDKKYSLDGLENIMPDQYDFVTKNLVPAAVETETLSDFNHVIKEGQTQWLKISKEKFNDSAQELSVEYYSTLCTKKNTNSRDNEKLKFVFRNYQLPRLLSQLEYIEKAPHNLKKVELLYLILSTIWPHSLHRQYLTNKEWQLFYQCYNKSVELVDFYLNEPIWDSTAAASSFLSNELNMLKTELLASSIVWQFKELLIKSETDNAYKFFIDKYHSKINNTSFCLQGLSLSDLLAKKNKIEKSLKVLDCVVSISNYKIIPKDSIVKRYKKLSIQDAEKRYSVNCQELGPDNITDSAFILSGIYKDLVTGKGYDLSRCKGKFVLLDFWATWCGPCKAEFPELLQLCKKYENNNQVIIISVCGDFVTGGGRDEETIKLFIANAKLFHPNLLDELNNSLVKRFNVSKWPSKFLFNKEGFLISNKNGLYSFEEFEKDIKHFKE